MLIENNETFLSELSKLFASNQTKGGSLYVTMKKYDGRTKPEPRKDVSAKYKGKMLPTKRKQTASESESEHKCLIRASLGGKKISTVISSRDVNKFQLAYSNLLKGNLYGLKKKDRKKASKESGKRATQ